MSEIARVNLEQLEFNNTKYTPMELMTILQERCHDFDWFSDRPKELPDRRIVEFVDELKSSLPSLALTVFLELTCLQLTTSQL